MRSARTLSLTVAAAVLTFGSASVASAQSSSQMPRDTTPRATTQQHQGHNMPQGQNQATTQTQNNMQGNQSNMQVQQNSTTSGQNMNHNGMNHNNMNHNNMNHNNMSGQSTTSGRRSMRVSKDM